MKRLLLLGALVASGCIVPMPPPDGGNAPTGLTSFAVTVDGVYQPDTNVPAAIVQSCTLAHDGGVPPSQLGTADCPYAIVKGDADFVIRFTALDANGDKMTSFNGPVSFRVVPGDLAASYAFRWANVVDGEGTARVRANHVFGQARIWVEDRPPEPIYVAGTDGLQGTLLTEGLPQEPAKRTNATGLSPTVYFQEPTLAALQEPSIFDNRDVASPFRGTFVTVGRAPAAGQQLVHDCPTDPDRTGQPLLMVVTGIDSAGFFVTDVNSCRIPERIYLRNNDPNEPQAVPEPDGRFPGTFGSIYVYNYNHPDGLNVGDALWALTGSIQEFTSTTQLVFASWNIADSVRLRPQSQWNLWLDRVPVPELTGRTCGYLPTPHLYDALCGYTRQNLKLESLESALVKLRNVKLPEVFPVCDRNADNQVEFFCDSSGQWTACPSPGNLEEIQCHIDCQTSRGEYARTVCTEGTSFNGFGQISVEMAGPGPAAAGLDASIAARTGTQVAVGPTSVRTASAYPTNTQLRVWCDGPVHYAFGGSTVAATTADPVLAGDTLLERFIDAGAGYPALLSTDATTRQCTLVVNPRTKVLSLLRDAVPEIHALLGCNPDGDTAQAEQCRFLRGARYDITGHLRQVQPARPRWMVIPRDADDLCCHPGPGLSCPTPIQPCE